MLCTTQNGRKKEGACVPGGSEGAARGVEVRVGGGARSGRGRGGDGAELTRTHSSVGTLEGRY